MMSKRKLYMCSLCANRDTTECSRMERLVMTTSPSSSSYLAYFKQFKEMCVSGQKWWTEEEKQEVLKELERLVDRRS